MLEFAKIFKYAVISKICIYISLSFFYALSVTQIVHISYSHRNAYTRYKYVNAYKSGLYLLPISQDETNSLNYHK